MIPSGKADKTAHYSYCHACGVNKFHCRVPFSITFLKNMKLKK